jgi:hypothetical protein
MRKTEADFRYCIAQSDYGVIILENGKQYAFPHHEYISAIVLKDVISFNIYYTDCARQYLEENEFNGNFRNMPEIKSVYVEVKDTRIYFFRMPRVKKQESR